MRHRQQISLGGNGTYLWRHVVERPCSRRSERNDQRPISSMKVHNTADATLIQHSLGRLREFVSGHTACYSGQICAGQIKDV